jgi:hypothetical protein
VRALPFQYNFDPPWHKRCLRERRLQSRQVILRKSTATPHRTQQCAELLNQPLIAPVCTAIRLLSPDCLLPRYRLMIENGW